MLRSIDQTAIQTTQQAESPTAITSEYETKLSKMLANGRNCQPEQAVLSTTVIQHLLTTWQNTKTQLSQELTEEHKICDLAIEVLNNTHIIDPSEFEQQFNLLKNFIAKETENGTWGLATLAPGKSNYWLSSRLLASPNGPKTTPNVIHQLSVNSTLNYTNQSVQSTIKHEGEQSVDKLFLIDDLSYSGTQLRDLMLQIHINNLSAKEVYICPLFHSARAHEKFLAAKQSLEQKGNLHDLSSRTFHFWEESRRFKEDPLLQKTETSHVPPPHNPTVSLSDRRSAFQLNLSEEKFTNATPRTSLKVSPPKTIRSSLLRQATMNRFTTHAQNQSSISVNPSAQQTLQQQILKTAKRDQISNQYISVMTKICGEIQEDSVRDLFTRNPTRSLTLPFYKVADWLSVPTLAFQTPSLTSQAKELSIWNLTEQKLLNNMPEPSYKNMTE